MQAEFIGLQNEVNRGSRKYQDGKKESVIAGILGLRGNIRTEQMARVIWGGKDTEVKSKKIQGVI